MDAAEQIVAHIAEALHSNRDLWVYDRYIAGPRRLEQALQVLAEKRESSPGNAEFLDAIIGALEKMRPS